MNESFENTINETEELPEKINISPLKYFWQASPISGNKSDYIPKFLRKISVFNTFNENELRIITSFLHLRNFTSKEIIFSQNDNGVGFYILFQGKVDIWALKDDIQDLNNPIQKDSNHPDNILLSSYNHIVTLDRKDYFGEMALLENQSKRNAMAIAKSECTLIGIFKPDIDDLLNQHPVIAAKFIQSLSVILTNRINSMANEIKTLKLKLSKK